MCSTALALTQAPPQHCRSKESFKGRARTFTLQDDELTACEDCATTIINNIRTFKYRTPRLPQGLPRTPRLHLHPSQKRPWAYGPCPRTSGQIPAVSLCGNYSTGVKSQWPLGNHDSHALTEQESSRAMKPSCPYLVGASPCAAKALRCAPLCFPRHSSSK